MVTTIEYRKCKTVSYLFNVLRRPELPQNGDKVPKFVVFWTISTIKDEKSAAKFQYIKTLSGKVIAHPIAFPVVSIAGGSSVPLIGLYERKGTDPHWKHLRSAHFAS